MGRFAQGRYEPKNPEKYVGTKVPKYRSSWELVFMRFCDENPAVLQWASEAIQIPYKDPLTNRQTVYVPDFFIQYADKFGRVLTELVEIKPASQQLLERVGKNKYNQAQYVRNMVKWEAAKNWCKQQGIQFRIITENDLFHTGKKMR